MSKHFRLTKHMRYLPLFLIDDANAFDESQSLLSLTWPELRAATDRNERRHEPSSVYVRSVFQIALTLHPDLRPPADAPASKKARYFDLETEVRQTSAAARLLRDYHHADYAEADAKITETLEQWLRVWPEARSFVRH